MSLHLVFRENTKLGFWAKVIGWRTSSPFSHVEIMFSDGTCFSASPKDGVVRFKPREEVIQDENWVIAPVLMVTAERERKIRQWCADKNGLKYDWEGIARIGSYIRRLPNPENKWFCSEICKAALLAGGIFKQTEEPGLTSPGKLFDEVRAWNSALLAGRYPQK